MKSKIIELVKNTRVVYILYYYIMSFFINLLRLFVKTDDRLVLFVSYGGRHFNDSPKCIYDAMKGDARFKEFKLVWAFRNINDYPEVDKKIKIDTLKYYVTALRARVWITNVHMERGLNFKGKKTYYLHTTHTVLPKLMGKHAVEAGCENFAPLCSCKFDCSCAQSEYERNIQSDMFEIPIDKVKLTGYPKNDLLTNYTKEKVNLIREELGIPINKNIILYAPTYRDEKNNKQLCPINFDVWQEILGDSYVVLFRAHPIVISQTKIDPNSSFVKDVSSYPYNTDLMAISDILISDYSGIFFEFGVQDKPMFCYAYDYDEYTKGRGLYFDIRDKIPGGHMTESELIKYVKNGDRNEIMSKCKEFKKEQITEYGHATIKCLDLIAENLNL